MRFRSIAGKLGIHPTAATTYGSLVTTVFLTAGSTLRHVEDTIYHYLSWGYS